MGRSVCGGRVFKFAHGAQRTDLNEPLRTKLDLRYPRDVFFQAPSSGLLTMARLALAAMAISCRDGQAKSCAVRDDSQRLEGEAPGYR